MKRYLVSCLLIALVVGASGTFFFNQYWIHRYDALISRQAAIYRLDEKLVWSVIYEETYFRPWKIGAADEVGLMQVTPLVARDWARETGFKEFAGRYRKRHSFISRNRAESAQTGRTTVYADLRYRLMNRICRPTLSDSIGNVIGFTFGGRLRR